MRSRSALRRVLTDDGLAHRMSATSRGLAASLLWPAVAASYVSLAQSLLADRALSVA